MLDWDEDDNSDRIFSLKVNTGDRLLDMAGDLYVEDTSRVNQDLTTDSDTVRFDTLSISTQIQESLSSVALRLYADQNYMQLDSIDDMYFDIDHDNTTTDAFFRWTKDAGGTTLMQLDEDGSLTLPSGSISMPTLYVDDVYEYTGAHNIVFHNNIFPLAR